MSSHNIALLLKLLVFEGPRKLKSGGGVGEAGAPGCNMALKAATTRAAHDVVWETRRQDSGDVEVGMSGTPIKLVTSHLNSSTKESRTSKHWSLEFHLNPCFDAVENIVELVFRRMKKPIWR